MAIHLPVRRLTAALAALMMPTMAAPAAADPPASTSNATAGTDQPALDRAFADLLTNARLTGYFSSTGNPDAPPRKDSYTIVKAVRADADRWAITAKVEYKGFALPVEIKVPVKWAGDTPVISVTDQKIAMLGTFTARVMFYKGEYAGTWSGGPGHGGQMWGKVEKTDVPAAGAATKPAK